MKPLRWKAQTRSRVVGNEVGLINFKIQTSMLNTQVSVGVFPRVVTTLSFQL